MSKELLTALNGSRTGAFHRWLANFRGDPRIAWYPSAGEDFRDLLYLHPNFSQRMPAETPEPEPPDLFLHTDYFPWSTSRFLDHRRLHFDDRTSVTLQSFEELPRCDLPLDGKIVTFPNGSAATGRVLFMEVEVSSNVIGTFTAPVLYVFAENGAFCAKRILPNAGKLSHVIHIRYGGGCGGGGKSTGIWLLNILGKVGCECFITDSRYSRQSGDERTYACYPELTGPEDTSGLQTIRVLPSQSWSGYGPVSWQVFKRSKNRNAGEQQPSQTQPDWPAYFTKSFPGDLTAYAAKHPDRSSCVDHPHCCQAPQERRVLFDTGQIRSLDPMLACSWYGLTLLNQGLFRYFPERVDDWLAAYPYLKLPVQWYGFGCVKVMAPYRLLVGIRSNGLISSFLNFYAPQVPDLLGPSGVSPQAFFDRVCADGSFRVGHRGSPDFRLVQSLCRNGVISREPSAFG